MPSREDIVFAVAVGILFLMAAVLVAAALLLRHG